MAFGDNYKVKEECAENNIHASTIQIKEPKTENILKKEIKISKGTAKAFFNGFAFGTVTAMMDAKINGYPFAIGIATGILNVIRTKNIDEKVQEEEAKIFRKTAIISGAVAFGICDGNISAFGLTAYLAGSTAMTITYIKRKVNEIRNKIE